MAATLLQAVFAWKLSQDAANDPNNKKLQGELLVAELALGAGLIDLGSTVIKGLAKTGDKALSFQALKIGGGVLSAAAGVIAGRLDFEEANKAEKNHQYHIADLYTAKGYANFAAAGLFLLSTLSYAQPAIKSISERYTKSLVARGFNLMFGRLFALRAGLMLGGMALNIAVICIQAVIWYFSDNLLQTWCEECAFGKERKLKTYSTAEIQMKWFGAALEQAI